MTTQLQPDLQTATQIAELLQTEAGKRVLYDILWAAIDTDANPIGQCRLKRDETRTIATTLVEFLGFEIDTTCDVSQGRGFEYQ